MPEVNPLQGLPINDMQYLISFRSINSPLLYLCCICAVSFRPGNFARVSCMQKLVVDFLSKDLTFKGILYYHVRTTRYGVKDMLGTLNHNQCSDF